MIVRADSPILPNVGRLRGMTVPSVEGPVRLGYMRAGMGLLIPIDPASARRPRAAGVRRLVRGRGMGSVINYCQNNPPDAATQAIISGRGDSIALVPCGGIATPYGQGGNQPLAPVVQPIGTAPVYQPPTGVEDCVALGLATSAGQACVARNTQRAIAAENQHLQDDANYQTALCIQNGGGGWVPPGADLATWCSGQYQGNVPASYAPTPAQPQSGVPATSVSAPPPAAVPAAPVYHPSVKFMTARGSKAQVGDGWSVSVTGGAPNSAVVVTGVHDGQSSTSTLGQTDGSGNFTTSGTFTADTVGSWSETWVVGGVTAGTFSFSVSAAPQSSGAGASIVPTGTGTNPVASVEQTVSDLWSSVTGAASGAGIPTWGWIAAAGVGALILFGGHRH